MKIIKLKDGELIFVPQTIEDLWAIKSITNKSDVISGESYRRQRSVTDDDSVRKPVYVHIDIEKYDFSESLRSLRFTGKIVEASPQDLAPLGDYHTLEVILNKTYKLKKPFFYKHEIDLLNSSAKSSITSSVILVTIDDEVANIYELSNIGVNDIAEIRSGKTGKRYNTSFDFSDFFKEVSEVVSRFEYPLIIAGCGHIKRDFISFTKPKDYLEVNLQNLSRSSISELFKKPEVAKFFTNSIIYKEQLVFDKFMENLGKNNNKSVYGLKEIKRAIDMGAVETILISEDLWRSSLDEIQDLIKQAETISAKIHIVDQKHDISRALRSFGGIIATLRYPLVI